MTLPSIERSLGVIEGKLDGITESLSSITAALADHDQRLRTLESKSSWLHGVAAAIGALVTLLTQALTGHFKGHF